jgi:signal transduction histidine kinase
LSMKIMELHKGQMVIKSELHKGTLITLYLPVSKH